MRNLALGNLPDIKSLMTFERRANNSIFIYKANYKKISYGSQIYSLF